MRYVFLLLLLAAAAVEGTAAAQTAPEKRTTLSHGQEAALLSTAVLTTVGSGALLVRVSEAADLSLTSTTFLLVALPAVAPSTVCALGSAMNLGGRCGQAFRSAFLSALPGYALVGLGLAMQNWDGLGLAALGGIGLVLAPPFAATDGYRRSVTPAVLSDPVTRELVPGVQLHIGL